MNNQTINEKVSVYVKYGTQRYELENKIKNDLYKISKTIASCKNRIHFLSAYNLLINFQSKYSYLKNKKKYNNWYHKHLDKLVDDFVMHKRITLADYINSNLSIPE